MMKWLQPFSLLAAKKNISYRIDKSIIPSQSTHKMTRKTYADSPPIL